MPKDTLNVALIGHRFVARAHNHGYTDVNVFFTPKLRPVRHTLCAVGDDVADTAARWGWQKWTADWRTVIDDPEVDMVDICAPSRLHRDIALAAAAAGKHVLCEKPLAMDLAGARQMLQAAEAAGIVHSIGFNKRKVPAIAFARRLIEDGRIGRIFHFRGVYSQDWLVDPSFPLAWRLRRKDAGYGSSGDLGAHVIDLARYLAGELSEVVGMQSTFIAERPVAASEDGLAAVAGTEMGKVDVDDASSFLARFASGAHGLFEQTRYATGHRNQTRIEVYGSEGGLIWNGIEEMNNLYYYSRRDPGDAQGFRLIQVGEASHPYTANWFPAGHIIGYGDTFVHEILDFIDAVAEGKPASPSFYDGVKTQEVMAAVERSVDERRWVKLDEL